MTTNFDSFIIKTICKVNIDEMYNSISPNHALKYKNQWSCEMRHLFYSFIIFENHVDLDVIFNAFEKNINNKSDITSFSFPKDIQAEKDLYLYSVPAVVQHTAIINSIIHSFDNKAFIKHPPGLYVINPSSDEMSIIFQAFLPVMNFNGETMKLSVGDSFQIPYVLIQNLPIGTTKQELLDFMRNNGYKTEFIELVQNQNLGNITAEVVFADNEQALEFIKMFKYYEYKKNCLIIKHYFSPSQLEEMKKWRIKVANLPPKSTLKSLDEEFSQYGYIVNINLRDDKATIEFLEKSSALKVIKNPPNGINVCFLNRQVKKLIVLNFPINIRVEEIQNIFQDGFDIKILTPKYHGMRPNVHISFRTEEDMIKAKKIGSVILMSGMRLLCIDFEEFNDRIGEILGSMNSENSIFVFNLPKDWNMEDVVENFCQYGNILYVKFSSGKHQKNGFAGILYENPESVKLAFNSKISNIVVQEFSNKVANRVKEENC